MAKICTVCQENEKFIFVHSCCINQKWCRTGWCRTRWCRTRWCRTRWCRTRWCRTRWCRTGWCRTRWCRTRWCRTRWCRTRWCRTRWCRTRWCRTRWCRTGWYRSRWCRTRWCLHPPGSSQVSSCSFWFVSLVSDFRPLGLKCSMLTGCLSAERWPWLQLASGRQLPRSGAFKMDLGCRGNPSVRRLEPAACTRFLCDMAAVSQACCIMHQYSAGRIHSDNWIWEKFS
uniref:Uncharacterized protein n=1 Tax=Poecilia reticulata TaxID=8081 RepID=A0A3P9N5S6_POERE